MKKNCIALIMACLFFMPIGSALSGSTITYSEPAIFSGCEFRVFFPTKTKRKSAFANGIESTIVQSIYGSGGPFMRAECLPLSAPNETIAAFRSILKNQAQNAGIKNPEVTIEKTELGSIGTYSGVRKAGGFDIKFFGKLVIGQSSLLSLLVSEELEKFPSDKVLYFLNTIEKK